MLYFSLMLENGKSKKSLQKVAKKTEISLTKKILISANVFYFLIFLGFCFTVNLDHPTIFHRYTLGYLKSLTLLFFLAFPYNLLLLFILKGSFLISFRKRTYAINMILRSFIALIIIILALLLVELFLRIKPKPFVEDFHPFLQAIPTKKNEGSLHINSYGFRYDEISLDKPKGVYRIFLLGGSTAFDETRSYENNLSKQIENALRKHYHNDNIQVINGGYNRYTSEHSLIEYETKVQDFKPDLIVIFQGYNDMISSCTLDTSPIKTYKNDYSHFYEVISNIINDYFNWKFHFLVIDRILKAFGENFYADIRAKLPRPKSRITYTDDISFPSLNAFNRNTTDLIKLVKADNVKIIIGNQAMHYNNNSKNYLLTQHFCKKSNFELISNPALNRGIEYFNQTSKKIAQDFNVPFVDIDSQVPRTDRYLTDDVHYTNEGDKRVAGILYNAIVTSSYLDKLNQ